MRLACAKGRSEDVDAIATAVGLPSSAYPVNTYFGERYLYAGLGSTFTLGATPRAISAGERFAPTALDDDVQSYQGLLAASNERRRSLFTKLQRKATTDGAYLAQWRRSTVGCC